VSICAASTSTQHSTPSWQKKSLYLSFFSELIQMALGQKSAQLNYYTHMNAIS